MMVLLYVWWFYCLSDGSIDGSIVSVMVLLMGVLSQWRFYCLSDGSIDGSIVQLLFHSKRARRIVLSSHGLI